MVLLKGANDVARAFYDYLLGEQAVEILSRHGFARPKES
jgi:ABC-type molybdate transport system substrate-binding protein